MEQESSEISFDDWIAVGIKKGWCGPPVCYVHDGLPTTQSDDEAWDNGDDPCIHVIRLYEDEEQKLAVELNHSPSVWRNVFTNKN